MAIGTPTEAEGFIFKDSGGFNFSTLSKTRESANQKAQDYFRGNENFYHAGIIVPVKIIQQAEYR